MQKKYRDQGIFNLPNNSTFEAGDKYTFQDGIFPLQMVGNF